MKRYDSRRRRLVSIATMIAVVALVTATSAGQQAQGGRGRGAQGPPSGPPPIPPKPLVAKNDPVRTDRVEKQMGGRQKTGEFLRFYLAPGVGHCGGGPGPAPGNLFEAVVRWVEEGVAPETLTAIRRDQTGAVIRSRPLCRYPLGARYSGKGSTDDAVSFTCAASF
jgi:hypothetical protein